MPQQASQEPAARTFDAIPSGNSARAQPQQADSSSSGPTTQSGSSGQIPAITLPKGGGAIRGMGEKFDVNPVTGSGATRDNVTSVYGKDNNSRIFDPNDPNFEPDDPQKPPRR